MSYYDPPPHQFTPQHFSGDYTHPSISQPFPGGYTQPSIMQREQHDSMETLDPSYPNKRPRNSENPQNLMQNMRVNPPHLPGSRGTGTGHIFYKTRLCVRFMQGGGCPNGSTCSFAHGHVDLRKPPPNWQTYIQEKDRGSGSDTNAGDNRLPRMKICNKYYNGEECPYGDRCNFLHERRNPPRVEGFLPGRRESYVGNPRFEGDEPDMRETTFISIGPTENARSSSCGDGDQQKMVYWKTKLCAKWKINQCTYGDMCHYAHGVSDLKAARVDTQPTSNYAPAPMNPFSVIVSDNVPANLPKIVDGDERKKLNWKLGKKINQIYGDWLDNRSPRRHS